MVPHPLVGYAAVARGEAQLFVDLPPPGEFNAHAWAHAAGALIVHEAGGRVTDAKNNDVDHFGGLEDRRRRRRRAGREQRRPAPAGGAHADGGLSGVPSCKNRARAVCTTRNPADGSRVLGALWQCRARHRAATADEVVRAGHHARHRPGHQPGVVRHRTACTRRRLPPAGRPWSTTSFGDVASRRSWRCHSLRCTKASARRRLFASELAAAQHASREIRELLEDVAPRGSRAARRPRGRLRIRAEQRGRELPRRHVVHAPRRARALDRARRPRARPRRRRRPPPLD